MLPHRPVGEPTPNQNNAITSLVQARFGNGIIFLARLRRWRWENDQHKPFNKVSVKPFQRLAGSKGRALVASADGQTVSINQLIKFRSSLFKGLRDQRAEPLSISAEIEISLRPFFWLLFFGPSALKEK